MAELQQTVGFAIVVAFVAIILAGFAIWFAYSTKKAQKKNALSEEEILGTLRELRSVGDKADRMVMDRVSEHLRSALGNPDSGKALGLALVSHPVFLDRLVNALSDGDLRETLTRQVGLAMGSALTDSPAVRAAVAKNITDRMPDYLSEYGVGDEILGGIVEAAGGKFEALSEETQQKLRGQVAEYFQERISDLLSEDDDLREKVSETLADLLPAVLKELVANDAKFREKLVEAVVGHVSDVFANAS